MYFKCCCKQLSETGDVVVNSRDSRRMSSLRREDHIPSGPRTLQEPLEISRLRLKVLQSKTMLKDSEIIMNPTGLENSQQSILNGRLYIGKSEEQNDIALHEDQGIAERQCVIVHESGTYYLKDLQEGSSTFIKVTYKMNLTDKNLLRIGECLILIQIKMDNILEIELLQGTVARKRYTFCPQDQNITLGRHPSCGISLEFDKSLSRVQSSIDWDGTDWVIQDGDGSRVSSNGTWIHTDASIQLKNSCIFKVGQTLFEAEILESQSN